MKIASRKMLRFHRSFGVTATAILVATCLVTACTYRGYDDPASRKLTWFSYLNGDDIRAQCVEGAPTVYRFVYNADYEKQVRTYDLAADPNGGLSVTARVIGKADHSSVTLSFTDFSELEGSTTSTALGSDADRQKLDAALRDSTFYGPVPKGLSMQSNEYYWLGVVCENSAVKFNAFKWPSPDFDALTFPAVLMAMDQTGVPLRNTPDPARYNPATVRLEGDRTGRFSIVIDDNGLRDHGLGL
jgi:hypothetical protein